MLFTLRNLQSRSATAENRNGEKGKGGIAGNGHKGAPALKNVMPGQLVTLMESDGPGMIRRIWMTFPHDGGTIGRELILRIYYDNCADAGVEVPIGDFFGVSHARLRHFDNELFGITFGKGYNCRIPMPFNKHIRVTLENKSNITLRMLFYEVDYTLGDPVDENTGYFHAQFRRLNPCPFHTDYTVLDGVKGRGVYLGTVLGVRSRWKDAWWGEGEFKFYIDGDTDYPTICGTGTEDYIGAAWGLGEFSTPTQGCTLCDDENGYYSIYRLHTADPIYFRSDLRVTVQQIGFGYTKEAEEHYGEDFVKSQSIGQNDMSEFCYFDRSDDYSSVAYWYQTLPAEPFPPLPDIEELRSDLIDEEAVKRSDI